MQRNQQLKPDTYLVQIQQQHISAGYNESSSTMELLEQVHRVAVSGDRAQLDLVLQIQAQIYFEASATNFQAEHLAPLLVEIACCFDAFGMFGEALECGLKAVACCEARSETWAARKAHNALASFYLRICDFEKSAIHLERSLDIARRSGDLLGRNAALSNVVALLDAMDATDEALKLCGMLGSKLKSDPAFGIVRFQNAINGGQFAIRVGDSELLQTFVQDARQGLRCIGPISDVWLAQHYANRAVLLSIKYDPLRASKAIDRYRRGKLILANNQIDCMLIWAQAVCCKELVDRRFVVETRLLVRRMMKVYAKSSFYYNDLINAAIPLYERTAGRRANAIVGGLRLRLQRYHIAKHAAFFSHLHRSDVESSRPGGLENPVYEWSGLRASYLPDRGRSFRRALPLSSLVKSENIAVRLRSEAYDAAENWAVAAEYSIGRAGFSFRVGSVAALIAKGLSWSVEKYCSLELACRLHSIGTMSMGHNRSKLMGLETFDSEYVGREYTLAGYALLTASADPTLVLGASVALSHCEWFNGCGYPHGLRGEEIPVEARICSVAREYCVLIERFGKNAIGRQQALAQCEAMAGVQLDPAMVVALKSAMSLDSGGVKFGFFELADVSENRLFQARLQLSSSVYRALAE